MMSTNKAEFFNNVEGPLALHEFRINESTPAEGFDNMDRKTLDKVIKLLCSSCNSDLMTDPELITTKHKVHIRSTDRKFNWDVFIGENADGTCFFN